MTEIRDISSLQQRSAEMIADKFFDKIGVDKNQHDYDMFTQTLVNAMAANGNSATGYNDTGETGAIINHLLGSYDFFKPGETASQEFLAEVLAADDSVAEWHDTATKDGEIGQEDWTNLDTIVPPPANGKEDKPKAAEESVDAELQKLSKLAENSDSLKDAVFTEKDGKQHLDLNKLKTVAGDEKALKDALKDVPEEQRAETEKFVKTLGDDALQSTLGAVADKDGLYGGFTESTEDAKADKPAEGDEGKLSGFGTGDKPDIKEAQKRLSELLGDIDSKGFLPQVGMNGQVEIETLQKLAKADLDGDTQLWGAVKDKEDRKELQEIAKTLTGQGKAEDSKQIASLLEEYAAAVGNDKKITKGEFKDAIENPEVISDAFLDDATSVDEEEKPSDHKNQDGPVTIDLRHLKFIADRSGSLYDALFTEKDGKAFLDEEKVDTVANNKKELQNALKDVPKEERGNIETLIKNLAESPVGLEEGFGGGPYETREDFLAREGKGDPKDSNPDSIGADAEEMKGKDAIEFFKFMEGSSDKDISESLKNGDNIEGGEILLRDKDGKVSTKSLKDLDFNEVIQMYNSGNFVTGEGDKAQEIVGVRYTEDGEKKHLLTIDAEHNYTDGKQDLGYALYRLRSFNDDVTYGAGDTGNIITTGKDGIDWKTLEKVGNRYVYDTKNGDHHIINPSTKSGAQDVHWMLSQYDKLDDKTKEAIQGATNHDDGQLFFKAVGDGKSSNGFISDSTFEDIRDKPKHAITFVDNYGEGVYRVTLENGDRWILSEDMKVNDSNSTDKFDTIFDKVERFAQNPDNKDKVKDLTK